MKLKALIVDDQATMRESIKASLSALGIAEFQYQEAANGKEALAKFNPLETDILFVDWNMPEMKGIDLIRQVRSMKNTAHIPIVVVTLENSVQKVQEADADAFITKPFTPELLRRRLQPVIDSIPQRKARQAGPAAPSGFLGRLFRSK